LTWNKRGAQRPHSEGPDDHHDRDFGRSTISRRKLTVSGLPAQHRSKIRAFLKLKEGQRLSPKQLRDDAKAVADAYGSGGYVVLVITPEGTPAGPALIDVHYNIEEGTRSFVNRV